MPRRYFIPFVLIVLTLIAWWSWHYYLVGGPPTESSHNVEELLEIEQQLKLNPADTFALMRLAHYYHIQGELQQSINTYYQLLASQPDHVEVMMSLVTVMVQKENGSIGDRSQYWINKVLTLQPTHHQALWLAGLSAQQHQQWHEAVRYWQRLIILVDETNIYPDLVERLAAVKQKSEKEGAPSK